MQKVLYCAFLLATGFFLYIKNVLWFAKTHTAFYMFDLTPKTEFQIVLFTHCVPENTSCLPLEITVQPHPPRFIHADWAYVMELSQSPGRHVLVSTLRQARTERRTKAHGQADAGGRTDMTKIRGHG